jgi:hypothetical protein
MATEIRPINSADVARVAPVVRVALVVPEDPVESAVQAALVVPEDRVARVALVVPEDLGEPVVRAALVVPEDLGEPAVRAALVVPEDLGEPAVRVVLESPAAPEALARGHPRARLAVALRTKSVIAAHRPDLVVPLLEAEEDLAVVAETTREPAAAEAAQAWEAAVTVAAVAATVAVAAPVTVVVAAEEDLEVAEDVGEADAAAAAADAEDKRNFDGENYENRTKHYDILENHHARCSHPRNCLPRAGINRSAGEEGGCCEARRGSGNTSTRAKAIRHAETGSRRPYSGSD